MTLPLVTEEKAGWVDSNTFATFWSWYCDALELISAVRNMHEHESMMFQAFVTPEDCERALRGFPVGTFIVRLSRTSAGEVAVTYVLNFDGDRRARTLSSLVRVE